MTMRVKATPLVQALIDLHERIRQEVEQNLSKKYTPFTPGNEGKKWRVTFIKSVPETSYRETQETQKDPHPDYILYDIQAAFEIEAVEDGPRAVELYGRIYDITGQSVRLQAHLLSEGTLVFHDYKFSDSV